VESESEKEYNSSLSTFKETCAQWPKFVEYVEGTMLGSVKEKFVRVGYEPTTSYILTIPPQIESSHLKPG
jgi:hypothetical protein